MLTHLSHALATIGEFLYADEAVPVSAEIKPILMVEPAGFAGVASFVVTGAAGTVEAGAVVAGTVVAVVFGVVFTVALTGFFTIFFGPPKRD